MAEIAVSGAITAVTTVLPFLQKICSVGDRRNIEEVREWLNTMIAYLKDTEGREDTAGLKDRVQRVQDLAYETQDAIEEFMYEVPEHFHHHWITIALHDIAHFFKDFLPLCRFSSRMADIKKEVDDIGDFDTIRFCPSQVASSSTTAKEVSGTYNSFSRNDHHVLVGITKRVDVLLDRVSMGDQPRYLRDIVIPVIGDPGSGKSTVIHEVFEMVKNSFECKAWVSVTPFCKDFLEKLCQELELPFDPGRHNKRSLQFHLQQKTYILVFDGIWFENQWKCIEKLLSCTKKQGSKIIISTRNRNLASICTSSHDYIYDLNLTPLTSEEALELFCKKVFKGDKCPDHFFHLVDWCKKIMIRCEESPHAIVAVSNFLSNKPLNGTEFKNVLGSLEFEPGHPVSLSCYRIFSRSYYHLLPNLRSCFLYFCNFPEGHLVTRGRLIRQWIGCGFIEKRECTTLEQVAYEYLDELVQMSMVRVTGRDSGGRIRSCQVSNLARGFILSMSDKRNFNVLRSSSASLGGEKTRGLSLHNCPLSMLQGTDLSYVRTFSMFGGDKFSESMANELFKNFKLMKNLNLENAALQHFPKEVVNLTLLRYLSLRSTKIDSVPKSIKKLQNLEFLGLRNTLITKLPKEIFGLPKLLCLFVGCPNAVVGAQVYPGIECSTSLQKLSLIKANYKEKSIVKELGNFTDLRKLGITELKEIEGKDLCASIEKMKHLYSLSVSSASKEVYLDLKDMKESPRLLQKLSLGGRLKEIPAWVGELYNLYKIELKWSKLQNSPLEALHALPSLKELHLYAAYTGVFLEFIAQPFLELRILEVEQCNQLNQVVILEQALPKLQKLIIINCDRLAMVHITMNMLSQLEEVRVHRTVLD
ncbi:disease resistance protein RPM1-like [Castanea sativa]|uniref:disease resistance protein RPM1-like n=1 Tax=Castanea sativa TaxID=21020 RepID=UPI003F64D8BA